MYEIAWIVNGQVRTAQFHGIIAAVSLLAILRDCPSVGAIIAPAVVADTLDALDTMFGGRPTLVLVVP